MKELLFLGDSITDCYHSFDKENLGNGYVRIIAEALKSHVESVSVKNMGRDGFTLPALNRLWNIYHKEMDPSIVTILIGINDVSVMKTTGQNTVPAMQTFQKDLEVLIKQIQTHTACPIILMEPFIFPHPAEYAAWESDVLKINEIIRQITDAHHLTFLPLWNKLKSAAKKNGYGEITLDGIHLTQQGHKIIADTWLDWYFHTFKPI
ncbi:MAG: SGNH/GDSL hydrolase family protein [Ruminococcus sp.]|nr:SGNH/GDSL hydrolase family protein [Ruminococcus sp.]